MFRLLLLFSFSFNLLANPKSVYPLGSSTLTPGAYGFDLSMLYSQTLSYYDVNGEEIELGESDDYKLLDFDLGMKYGFSDNIEFGISSIFRQVSSESTLYSQSNSGIDSIALFTKYSFENSSSYNFAISGEYRYRPYENAVYLPNQTIPESDIVLGDSGTSFLLNFHFDSVISKWTTFESSFGYHIPANDLSSEIPYRVALVKNFNTWAFWGGVKGVISLGQDEFKSAPEQKVKNANGSTYRWNSINRSYMMPFAGVRILIANKYRLGVEFGQTFSGTSTDNRFDGMVTLSWNRGGVSKESRFENSFKEYNAEATIIKISPRGKFVKIDKGLIQDVAKAMRCDIYKSDYFGGNILIASGLIYEAGSNWSIVKIDKVYKNLPIEKGLTVRIK